MNFRDWIITEAKKLEIKDPTGLGMSIVAKIHIVPGPTGKGAYSPSIEFFNRLKYGGAIYHTGFEHSLEAAQTALRKRLQQPFAISVPKELMEKGGGYEMVKIEVPGLSAVGTHKLEPVMTYGGSWDSEAMKRWPEYDPERHEKSERKAGELEGVMRQFQKEMSAEMKRTPKFGDGPPKFGQWLSKDDVALIPDMIETFGDFWLIIKWAKRDRQAIKASDLHKNYDRIFADAEVKTGDYAREIFVRDKPQQGI
jgi:hypothetical protein